MADEEPGSSSERPGSPLEEAPIDPSTHHVSPLKPAFEFRVRDIVEFVPTALTEPAPTTIQDPGTAVLEDQAELEAGSTEAAQTPLRIENYRPYGPVQMLKHNFPLGCIFHVIHHAPKKEQQNGAFIDPRSEVLSAHGTQYVYSKGRKMIVVAQFEKSCICIPIFTHNGRGLVGRPAALKEEFIAIKDVGDPNPTHTDSTHVPLMATRPDFAATYDPTNFTHFSPFCYAHFTRPYTILYGSEGAWAGDLKNDEDIRRLQSLVCGWSPAAELEADFPPLGGSTVAAAPVPIKAPAAPIQRTDKPAGKGGRKKYNQFKF